MSSWPAALGTVPGVYLCLFGGSEEMGASSGQGQITGNPLCSF